MLSTESSKKIYDFCIIGGGYGGMTFARNALKNNLSVAIVEMRPKIGGSCLFEGCIPSKFLLNISKKYSDVKNENLEKYGITVENSKINMTKVIEMKEELIQRMGTNNTDRLKLLGCDIFNGRGRVKSIKEVEVDNGSGEKQLINCKNIIISTGSESSTFPENIIKIDGVNVLNSRNALNLNIIPKKLSIIGGGYIGCELGSYFNRLGSDVTIVDISDRILLNMDNDVSVRMKSILEKQGIKFHLNSKVLSVDVESKNDSHKILIENNLTKTQSSLMGNKILIAIGRRICTNNLGLEEVGVKLDKNGKIEVNQKLQSSISNIYAIGDVTNKGYQLAHKAEDEALALLDQFLGKPTHLNYATIPNIVFTYPEVSFVGKTEEELKTEGINYNVGFCDIRNNPRAKCVMEDEGFVKILVEKETKKILGVHMISSQAGEQIVEGVISLEFGISAELIRRVSHFHPSFAEAFKEAANLACGEI